MTNTNASKFHRKENLKISDVYSISIIHINLKRFHEQKDKGEMVILYGRSSFPNYATTRAIWNN